MDTNYLQRCGSCGYQAVLPSRSDCPTCQNHPNHNVRMSACIAFNTGAHHDMCVCLQCGRREKSRHNIACQDCEVMMVYEAAWAKFELYKQEYTPNLIAAGQPASPATKQRKEEEPAQLGLFAVGL